MELDPDESTSLLAHDTDQLASSPTSPQARKYRVLLITSILTLTVNFGFYLALTPQTQIFESIICRGYYSDVNKTTNANENSLLDDRWCKSAAVQSELALITGWKNTFEVIPGIFFALPYGILADHWGRRPVLYLGLTGILLGEAWVRLVCLWPRVLPLRLVWLSGLWKSIGGGDQVVTTIALTMVTDLVSEDERTTALFCLMAFGNLAEILASPVSAWLMTSDPWLPYVLGGALISVGTISAIFLPETLEDVTRKMKDNAPVVRDGSNGMPITKRPSFTSIVHQIKGFKQSTSFIWMDRNLILFVVSCFAMTTGPQSTDLLLQYTSKRFHWSFARASLLVSLRGVVTLGNFLVVMPSVSYLVTRYLHLEAKWKDLLLSKGTGLITVAGYTVLGFSGTPPVFMLGLVFISLGTAFAVVLRSLATSLVPPDHVGTIWSAATVVTSIGAFVAGPVSAYIYRFALDLGDAWLGLPFLEAALVFTVSVILISYIRLPQSIEEDH